MTKYESIGIKLCAPNDRNGNPKRVYIAFPVDGGQPCAFDENYNGIEAVPQHIREQVKDFYRVNVSASEYRDWLGNKS